MALRLDRISTGMANHPGRPSFNGSLPRCNSDWQNAARLDCFTAGFLSL